MPIYDLNCEDCGATYEYLLRKQPDIADEECKACGSKKLRQSGVSAHGGYSISGDNSASRRPRGAGSFGRKK